MLIRPTVKLARLLKIRLEEVPADPPEGSWFASLLWHQRRKLVLATHAPTLYSLLLVDVSASDLRPLSAAIVPELRKALLADGLGQVFDKLVPSSQEERFAKTNNRSVVGVMSQIALELQYTIPQAAEFPAAAISEFAQWINGRIALSLSEGNPRGQLRFWLQGQSG